MSGIKLCQVRSHQEKRSVLESFSPRNSTWLVSDLKSKRELQKILLAKHGAIADTAVLRASELWRKLLGRVRQDASIVSTQLARALIRNHLATREDLPLRGGNSADVLLKMTAQFLPILTHPQGIELVDAWLEGQPESRIRWQHWLRLSAEIWQKFSELGILPQFWLTGALANVPDLGRKWGKNLVVDLGAQVSALEVDLLRSFSREVDVTVLVPVYPTPAWGRAQGRLYERFASPSASPIAEDLRHVPWQPEATFHRYTTVLGEVKGATAQVRKWLEAGIDLQDIGIVAPDIETYWPSLSAYLEQEGIPVNKGQVARLHGLTQVQGWLAQLRLKLGQVSAADLELRQFPPERPSTEDYARFWRLFSLLDDARDLARDEHIARLYQREHRPQDILNTEEFLVWAVRHWSAPEWPESVEGLLHRFLQDCPPGLRLSLEVWRQYLEELISGTEVPLKSAQAGIQAVSLSSAEWLSLSHVFFVGCTDQSLRKPSELPLTRMEVERLEKDLGFLLPFPESSALESEFYWFLSQPRQQLILSFAVTDTAGQVQSPHPNWILWQVQQGTEPKQILEGTQVPGASRWDEIQRATASEIARVRGWGQEHAEALELALQQDLGLLMLPQWRLPAKPRLSASRLEKFAECPFRSGAEFLGLSDDQALDVDLEASAIGRWQHAVVTELALQLDRNEWSQTALRNLILSKAHECEVVFGDPAMQDVWLERMLQVGQDFLRHEKQWQRAHPGMRVLPPQRFQGAFSLTTGEFCRQPSADGEEFLAVRGEIDRVDMDEQGEAIVVDYKRSRNKTKNFSSWPRNDSFQLWWYTEALASGLCQDLERDLAIAGAMFYSLQPPERRRGLMLKPDAELSSRALASAEKWQQVSSQLRAQAVKLATKMVAGEFAPAPKNEKICDTCNWRRTCRYPKFN